MTRDEANRKAEEACEKSPFVHAEIVAVLEAFGLIKIEEEPKESDNADA